MICLRGVEIRTYPAVVFNSDCQSASKIHRGLFTGLGAEGAPDTEGALSLFDVIACLVSDIDIIADKSDAAIDECGIHAPKMTAADAVDAPPSNGWMIPCRMARLGA